MEAQLRTVFIVDDVPTMRERLGELVSDIEGVEIVGNAGTPSEAIDGILRTRPDCVLLDYQLIGGTGVDVLRAVHPRSPSTAFIVLTNNATPQHRRACLTPARATSSTRARNSCKSATRSPRSRRGRIEERTSLQPPRIPCKPPLPCASPRKPA